MIRTFTHPETGTRHLLESNPNQKTLKVPDSFEFPATSRCGNARLMLRMGDLGSLDNGIIDPNEQSDMCRACVEYSTRLILDVQAESEA